MDFDEAFPDGVFAIPASSHEPIAKVRALCRYCEEQGVKPEDLTEAEIATFLVYDVHDG